MSAPTSTHNPNRRVGWASGMLVLLLVIAGGLLRLWRLGSLGLIVDEGYQASAVQGILKHGYPLLDTGFLYSRSIAFLYLQALSTLCLGFSEWSLRLPAAGFSVLAIPIAFWFGRSLFNLRVGLVLAAMVAFSAWELEYARYARFYSLFQCLYMIGLVAWYRGFIEMRLRWRWIFAAVFLFAITVHHLGVMLGLSFLIILPLGGYSVSRRVTYFFLSAACGMIWKLWERLDEQIQVWLGATDSWSAATPELDLPTGPAGIPGLRLPDFHMLALVWQQNAPMIVAGGVVLACLGLVITGLVMWGRVPSATPGPDQPALAAQESLGRRSARAATLMLILATALLNMVSLSMVFAIMYLACFVRRRRQLFRLEVLITFMACSIATMAWIIWFRASPKASLTAGLASMLSFPDVYQYWFYWMVYGWTAMLGLLVLAFFVLAARSVTPDCRATPSWFVLGSFMLPMLVTSSLIWKFSESRYFFHLYPLMLLALAVLAVAIADGIKRILPLARRPWGNALVTLACAAGVMSVADDTNLASALAVSQRTHASYRDPYRAVLNFRWHADFHQDMKTASLAAAEEIQPDDLIVVVGPPHQAITYRYYLGRIDFIVTSLAPYLTLVQQPDGYWQDQKSGGRLIYTADALEALRQGLEPGQRLWLFSDWRIIASDNWYLSDAEMPLKTLVTGWMGGSDPRFVGQDGLTTVHCFEAPGLDTEVQPPALSDPSALKASQP